jgi:hypothetical protein
MHMPEETPPMGGTCEHCGSPLNEHGLSAYLAEAEQVEPVEGKETDQHAASEAAFAEAFKKRVG